MLRLVRVLFQQVWAEIEGFFHFENPNARLESQLRLMYARGEITRQRYLHLRSRLRYGNILPSELNLLQEEARRSGEISRQVFLLPQDPEVSRAMDKLYIDMTYLEEAREQLRASKEAIRHEAAWFREQAELVHKEAQQAFPDEDTARRRLDMWQYMEEQSRQLEARLAALEQEGQDLQKMEAELRGVISTLRLLDVGEQQAYLRLHVRQDLITSGGKR